MTGSLSARAREKTIAHLPPIDMRYGWCTRRRADQVIILHELLFNEVQCLFAAPTSAMWSSSTNQVDHDVRQLKRAREEPGLKFLGLACLVQVLRGRHFMIESSGSSTILEESPLQPLTTMGLHKTALDQCMYGANVEDKAVKKSTVFASDVPVLGMNLKCDHKHQHLTLR